VVIVSYRCREPLRDCLDSLRAHPPERPMRVVVVDNASGDGTVEMVEAEYPEVELRANATNAGFAAATNLGIGIGDAPFVLALNPDTRVTEGALETVLGVLERDGRIAVAGPNLVLEDGRPDHAAKRSFPTPLSALGHFTGVGRRSRAPAALAAYRC
jgi:GT2 family glycosyltransferase